MICLQNSQATQCTQYVYNFIHVIYIKTGEPKSHEMRYQPTRTTEEYYMKRD